jgi:hypothetical protein
MFILTITSVMNVTTYITTSVTAHPIGLIAILVIMCVSTFITWRYSTYILLNFNRIEPWKKNKPQTTKIMHMSRMYIWFGQMHNFLSFLFYKHGMNLIIETNKLWFTVVRGITTEIEQINYPGTITDRLS